MRSAYADNGYNSPAVSTAVGPSPFSAAGGGPSGTPGTVGGGMMRTRTLTRRQSRLAPKPAPSGVAGVRLAVCDNPEMLTCGVQLWEGTIAVEIVGCCWKMNACMHLLMRCALSCIG
jgi:hypothetical protein